MNILILTGKFGLGHYSAAEALRQQILAEDPSNNIKVVDFIDYMFPELKDIIYGTFNFMVGKCHAIYNFFNDAASKNCEVPLKRTVGKRLHSLIEDNDIDIVIAAFPVCPQYINAYKKMFGNRVPLYTCITDIEAHDEWIAPGTDIYFVSTEETKQGLIKKGVEAAKIIISGIPVRPAFETPSDVVKNRREVLVMGGGLGLIPSLDSFLGELNRAGNVNITIIAGSNEKLYNELKGKYSGVNVVGFTNEVDRYMKRADLIITKAGGITLFEALHTETPLFVIKPFLSQEIGNAQFIENYNIGRVSWDKNGDVSAEILALINNEAALETMKRNMRRITASIEKVSYTDPLGKARAAVC